ncbi:DUF4112 domain-containing protein [Kordiimonas sp.]|uniref:DUF4112 domain-containing protein n=1 Tax=Kordiimonas sp. TaxID=1970157 RepID=UPI003A949DD1
MTESGHNRLTDRDRKRAQRIYRLARLLDSQFNIPVVNIRIGLDSILGLIPGAGDTLSALISAYILFEARRLGASRKALLKMLGNLGLDWIIGSIPLIGDIFDIGFKANLRNIKLLEDELGVSLQDV